MNDDVDWQAEAVAQSIRDTFVSVNAMDSNYEPANVVDGLYQLADAVGGAAKHLGLQDASTPMGAIEAHAKSIHDSAEMISGALGDIAESLALIADATWEASKLRSE